MGQISIAANALVTYLRDSFGGLRRTAQMIDSLQPLTASFNSERRTTATSMKKTDNIVVDDVEYEGSSLSMASSSPSTSSRTASKAETLEYYGNVKWPFNPQEYKGKTFTNLPVPFLQWIIKRMSQSDGERDKSLVRAARAVLSARGVSPVSSFGYRSSSGYEAPRRSLQQAMQQAKEKKWAKMSADSEDDEEPDEKPNIRRHGIEL